MANKLSRNNNLLNKQRKQRNGEAARNVADIAFAQKKDIQIQIRSKQLIVKARINSPLSVECLSRQIENIGFQRRSH